MHASIFPAYLQIGVQRHWGAGPRDTEYEAIRTFLHIHLYQRFIQKETVVIRRDKRLEVHPQSRPCRDGPHQLDLDPPLTEHTFRNPLSTTIVHTYAVSKVTRQDQLLLNYQNQW
jgi:hypothetical protein